MSIQQLGKILGIIGAIFLAHSAYSTYEHLAYVKAVDEEDASVPIEIAVECLVSSFIALLGVILSADSFKHIDMTDEIQKMKIDTVDTRPSFITFNHRQIKPSSK
ncbi:hypothetical protein G6F70_005275 [Rhizopus microsporus]|nr:hypothetical protein G6F71_005302 [Rhizopus microsporus]KAG1199032.1 hypothetical protein G6F70_005275 [Rhizopus microsporus]KAG1211888.1 hypothetical protein G6F69_004187 [Rhizopus microsporus]KAG1227828.1 hypothetical protein G6F67_008206 [Rhizopus microsporus]KAG1259590.1 hypothetical protein G6F68_008008 [Rhizopus microsporus]